MKDSDELLDELMETSFDKAINVSAEKISNRVRKKLKEQKLIDSSQKWMIQALLRHILSKILIQLKGTLKEELKSAADDIVRETEEIVRRQIERTQLRQGSMVQEASQASTSSGSSENLSELKDEVDDYKSRILSLSNQLDQIFNTLLSVYPELQALPIVERTGNIKITKLCRAMGRQREEIMPFLRKMEDNGILRVEGGRVKSIRPLFKRK